MRTNKSWPVWMEFDIDKVPNIESDMAAMKVSIMFHGRLGFL